MEQSAPGDDTRDVMLRLNRVSHSFHARKDNFDHGLHHVLRDVSFDVRRGEVLGVVGRNGVGKTTLLRLMAGILEPTEGKIERFPGASCALLSLGLGFQPQLSGRDNARLSAVLQGASVEEANASLGAICEFAELGASFEEPVKTYSSGMRARLGFAVSLYNSVDILLIDEVLAVGDSRFQVKAKKALAELIRSEKTVILVSHAERQISTLCTSAVLLLGGRVLARGACDEVLAKYRDAQIGN